jgi:hypothetical protein
MQHKRYDISIEDLRQLISYNPEVGILNWLPRPLQFCKCEREQKRWNSRCANKVTKVTKDELGYLRFKLFDVVYKAHRVCWALHYGAWLDQNLFIDHINNDPSDNRISNLRAVTMAQNNMNQRKLKKQTSSLKGVFWSNKDMAWRSRLIHDGKAYELGLFLDEQLAHQSYCNLAKELRGEYFKV